MKRPRVRTFFIDRKVSEAEKNNMYRVANKFRLWKKLHHFSGDLGCGNCGVYPCNGKHMFIPPWNGCGMCVHWKIEGSN